MNPSDDQGEALACDLDAMLRDPLVEPSEDFTDRVMGRIGCEPAAQGRTGVSSGQSIGRLLRALAVAIGTLFACWPQLALGTGLWFGAGAF